jgi:hypothetical protein
MDSCSRYNFRYVLHSERIDFLSYASDTPRETMSQYFHFYNVTRKQWNVKPIAASGGFNWVAKLNYYDAGYIIDIFRGIIANNEWDVTDTVEAVGDYGTRVTYSVKDKKIFIKQDSVPRAQVSDDEDA